jgi:hypothetical protein
MCFGLFMAYGLFSMAFFLPGTDAIALLEFTIYNSYADK